MNALAIIPARGGSKGIPRKNIYSLAGKPLMAYTIQQALASRKISKVVVSTDDEEIADVAREYGAEVVMRPEELALDATPTEPVLLHVLDYLEEKENYSPDLIVLLQITSPLVCLKHLEKISLPRQKLLKHTISSPAFPKDTTR